MLEDQEPTAIDHLVHRLANPPNIRAALDDLHMTLEETVETIQFLGTSGSTDAITLLETPFKAYSSYKPSPTRFTNGTWRVFYSALETETAEHERAHWCRKELRSQPPISRRFHYRHLQSRLSGQGFDVRPRHKDWPFLTDDDTYPQCQALASEAKSREADALLCPSARRPGGTTAPVFERYALSNPTILGVVVLEIEASGGTQIVRHGAGEGV
jgi:RES domain-containing protein